MTGTSIRRPRHCAALQSALSKTTSVKVRIRPVPPHHGEPAKDRISQYRARSSSSALQIYHTGGFVKSTSGRLIMVNGTTTNGLAQVALSKPHRRNLPATRQMKIGMR